METLDEMPARPSLHLTRAAGKSLAALADEIEARLMQRASPAGKAETPSTPNACPTFTGPLQDEESMPTLTDEIKTFIVKGLACYDTPSQVAEAVKATFGVEVSRQQVHVYDPASSQPPAQRWRDLHAATRQALLREYAEIGVAHKAVRLRMLDRQARRCERNSVVLALKCLEMAAKECGGMYENRKPVVLQPATPQPAVPESPAPQPAAIEPATPQPPVARPPVARRPVPPVMKPASRPERVAPQPQATPPAPPQPLAVLAQPPQPPASSAQPPALPAQPPALPEGRPLSREERYRAYVRDRHARDRAVAAQALQESGRISTVPPAS